MESKELKFIEDYAKTLDYIQGVSDYNRTLIINQLKAFYQFLKERKMIK